VLAPVAPVPAGVVVAGVLLVVAGVVVAGVLLVVAGVVVAGVLVVWLVLPVVALVEPLDGFVPLVEVGPRLSSVLVVDGVRSGALVGALSGTVEPPQAESAAALSVAAPSSASQRRRAGISPRQEACAARTSGNR
jgi:hypothetical protein